MIEINTQSRNIVIPLPLLYNEYRNIHTKDSIITIVREIISMETNERQEDWESLGLSNDFLFGKVMSNPKLCIQLLERIFPELEIERIEYPELQKTIKEDVDARSVRLDVYVKDSEEKVYDIEMQTTNNGELPKRSRYYQGMIDLQLINRGESYRELNQSYIIFICMEDIFKG